MGDTVLIETTADEVVSIVTQGPQGPSGSEAATLTTTGDLLYRAALANDRLPIGSEGQVLRVSSGLPAWGNESGAVTSVNGETGAVVLDAADVGAQAELVIFNQGTLGDDITLSAERNAAYVYNTFPGSVFNITLPIANNQSGDTIQIQTGPTFRENAIIRQQNHDGSSGSPQYTTLATIIGSNPVQFQKYTFTKTTSSDYGSWTLSSIDTHTHAASDITSGTLAHERGGLEADVSAYNGLLKISGGSTSQVSIGTGANDVAAGNHTHTQLHDKSHTMTDATSHTAGNHKVFYSDGSGNVQELALGSSGEVLTSNGASSAPSFAAAAAGGATNLWIPASAFIPKTTAGCGVDSRETATNDQNFDELLFDAGSDEFADALVVMPSNYNNGTITARFYWTAASGSGGVAWAIQGRALANDDALDTAAGTAQLVTDTLIAADDMHVTSATSAVTIGGTPAANTPIQFTIYRDVSDAADDLAVDARLLGVEIIFN